MPLSGQVEFAGFPVIRRFRSVPTPQRDSYAITALSGIILTEENMIFLVIFLITKSPAVKTAGPFVR
jgi:hypothetical protein